jgi:acyl-CoA oxidase
MQMFDWLLCYVLRNSHSKFEKSLKEGKDIFTARNENQIFFAKTLSIVFIEVNIIF